MYNPLRIGDLTARLPIIQGGMGVGVSLSNLAGAVAAEGGIGIISTAQIGYTEPEFKRKPLETNLKMIGEHIKKARKIAPEGILGVNIMVATQHYTEYVAEAVKQGIDLIISGAGLPLDLPSLVKNTKTKIAPIVSSKKAAEVLLKLWDRKDKATADAIIVEGPLAGGHLGFDKEYLKEDHSLDFESEIKQIIEVAKAYEEKYEKEIPVIVAGGIRNREQMEHFFSLGAKGIQVASKFVPTVECDAHPNYKDAYVRAKKEDITLVKSPVGMPGRALLNNFVFRTQEGNIKVRSCSNCLQMCNPATTPYCITEALINAVQGDVENGLIFCGAYGYEADRIRTVKEVLADFFG